MNKNCEQTDLNELIKKIDAQIDEINDEIKNNPSYNEEEEKEKLRKMQDYIKQHSKTSEEILKKINEFANKE